MGTEMGTETVNATEENVALLRAAYASVERGDLDASVELLTENFIANVPGAPEPLHGREIWRFGTQTILDAFPDIKITIEEIFGVDDKVVVRVHFRGTHRGEFQGMPATNREVSYRSIEIYRIEGDKIAEEWVAPDMISLMQQIAPVPAADQ